MKFIEKGTYLRKIWSWAWFSENTPTNGDFEIGLDTPQLHQTLKPHKTFDFAKKNLNSCLYTLWTYTYLILGYFKEHFRALIILILITTSMWGGS